MEAESHYPDLCVDRRRWSVQALALAVLLAPVDSHAAPPEPATVTEPTADQAPIEVVPAPGPEVEQAWEGEVPPPSNLEPHPTPAPRRKATRPRRGAGFVVGGALLAGSIVATVLVLYQCLDFPFSDSNGVHCGWLAVPLAGGAIGTTLMVVGGLRQNRYKSWRARHGSSFAPLLGPTQRGVAFQLRF